MNPSFSGDCAPPESSISTSAPISGTRPEPALATLRGRWQWLPLPVSACLILALWIADPLGIYESRLLSVVVNFLFTCVGSLFIAVLMARSFMATGQPTLLLFGCGALLWGCSSLVAAVVGSTPNLLITIHNLGIFTAALCHGAALLWRGTLQRRFRWLVTNYVLSLLIVGCIVALALTGTLPEFFHQGHGGTMIRQCILTASIVVLAWVAGRLLLASHRSRAAFTQWYGLGIALVAVGLTGVTLQSSFGSILGWSGRLTQYLGGIYLLVAALIAGRNTGTFKVSVEALDETLQKYFSHVQQGVPLAWKHYALAALMVSVTSALRWGLDAYYDVHLPPYVLYYPAIVLVALISGFVPSAVALVLADIVLISWGLTSQTFGLESPADRFALVVFNATCLFMSGIVALYQSLQQKAAIQQEIRALNRQLEQRVKERTAALEAANERLSAANQQLAEAMRAREAEMNARHRLEREILEISEREQSRLGQDLHDGLGQELAGIAMLTDVHARKLRDEGHALCEGADLIARYVRASINSARLLAKGHYPIELNRYGLLLALKDLATQTTERCGVACSFVHQGTDCDLEKSAEIHLYRIIQECVANAVKHARPQQITIEASIAPAQHVFTVADDGHGFKPPAENHGMGLHLIDYRARMIGAHIRRESVTPHGCRVVCSVNIPTSPQI